MPAVWAGAATAAFGAFGASKAKAASAAGPSNAGSAIDIDNSGWLVNFKGVASTSGSRDLAGGGAGSGFDSALTSDVQTPFGMVPAWAIVAAVTLIAIALKKRKK